MSARKRIADLSMNSYENKTGTKNPALFYIFYHGEVTEKEYFDGLIAKIPSRKSKVQLVRLQFAHGTPLQVYEKAKATLQQRQKGQTEPYDDLVWLVFDKDDFDEQDNQYSKAVEKAQNPNNSPRMEVAYSNECFELWLLLHFEDIVEPTKRGKLQGKLCQIRDEHANAEVNDRDKKFPFGLLERHGNRNLAVDRAESLFDKAKEERPDEPWNVNPVTRMHLLLRELNLFLK